MGTLFSHFKETTRSHEVNAGAVLAFREIGCGHSAMTTFSKVMNMPMGASSVRQARQKGKKA